ncbi:Glycosyl transferase [Gammaproteobacteria bacterium]
MIQIPNRILAIHVARIGDTLLTSAALRAIATHYSMAKIDFLGHSKRIAVMQHLPYLHRIGAINKRNAKFRGHLVSLLNRKPYDLTFVWGGHDPELIKYAHRVSRRLIISQQKEEQVHILADRVIPFPDDTNTLTEEEDKPLAQWLLDLVEQGLGITAQNCHADYYVTTDELKHAQTILTNQFGSRPIKIIGLVMESHPAGIHRNWPIDYFCGLLESLQTDNPDYRFVLLGDPLAPEKIASIEKILGERLVNLTGKLPLRDSAAVIARLDLYLGVDTGPSHIAAALGTPSVVMYHCMRKGELLIAPKFPQRLTIINHPTKRNICTFDTPMADIKISTVLAACRARLANG